MNDLADFLRARYAEAKSQAESIRRITVPTSATFNGYDVEWRYDMDKGEVLHINGRPYPIEEYWRQVSEPAPDLEVIADFEAKLALLADLTSERHEVVDGDCWYTCAAATEEQDGGETCDDNRRGNPCDCGRDARITRRLRILAQPFAGHPDYRSEEWAP